MTRINVKNIHRVRKRLADGSTVAYHYCWRGGPRFWKLGDNPEGGPAYWKAYQDACREMSPSHGLFREIITDFLKSRQFASYAPRTQADYQRHIHMKNGIDATFGSAPVAAFNDPRIRGKAYAWRDSFSSPRVADAAKQSLVRIVNWAVDRGQLRANYLAGMDSIYQADRSDLIWTDAEIDAFLGPYHDVPAAPDYLRRMFLSMSETGLRPGDLIQLSRQHIQLTRAGRRIFMRTSKRSRNVSIPVTPRMAEIIDATPSDRLHILVGEKGAPYRKASSAGRQVTRRKKQIIDQSAALGVVPPLREELVFYDLRGTAATRLFEADATLREIATAMGWSPQTAAKMIETYVAMNPDASDSLLLKLASAR